MKKIIFLFILIFFLGFVNSIDYGVWLHNIDIEINDEGNAQINEKFHLFFPNEDEKILFRENSKELGSNLDKWKNFDELFVPTIGMKNIVNGTIVYSEGEDNYLEISYGLADNLMVKGKETNFIQDYSIKANYLNKLYQSGLWIIPDNTRITFIFPPGAELNEGISPDAIIGNNGTKKTATWVGYKSANELKVKYVIWKKVNPIIDLNELNYFLFRTQEGLVVIFGIIILIGITIWKRNYFSSKIEKFVEDNTLFEED